MKETNTPMETKSATTEQPSVRINATRGSVRIVAPVLFPPADTSALHRLLQRLLQVDEVERIDVNYDASEVALAYNSRRLEPQAALAKFAQALQSGCDTRSTTGAPDVDFEQIVGRVLRVERRRVGGGVMTTIISAGADLWSAIAPRLGRSGAARAEGLDRDAESMLVNGFSIRYAPALRIAAPLPPAAAESLALIAHGSSGLRTRPTIVVAQGWRRAANLAAAGGCFFLSIVGLVTPGIPTVPFVLATSYFLVRSSPALDERLRRSRLFGQMVRDWTTYGGMRPGTKSNIVVITLVIMGGTLLIVEPSLPILLVMAVMGTLGVSLILSAPTVPQDAPDDVTALVPA